MNIAFLEIHIPALIPKDVQMEGKEYYWRMRGSNFLYHEKILEFQ